MSTGQKNTVILFLALFANVGFMKAQPVDHEGKLLEYIINNKEAVFGKEAFKRIGSRTFFLDTNNCIKQSKSFYLNNSTWTLKYNQDSFTWSKENPLLDKTCYSAGDSLKNSFEYNLGNMSLPTAVQFFVPAKGSFYGNDPWLKIYPRFYCCNYVYIYVRGENIHQLGLHLEYLFKLDQSGSVVDSYGDAWQ